MKKSFIVEDVRANLDKITCLTDEIKEGIDFRCLNAIGVWHTEGKDAEGDLWDKVEAYIGVPLAVYHIVKINHTNLLHLSK